MAPVARQESDVPGVVAEGAVKPTSVYTVERVENSLDVVAHLSEGISRFWLEDSPIVHRTPASKPKAGLSLSDLRKQVVLLHPKDELVTLVVREATEAVAKHHAITLVLLAQISV